MMVKFICIIRDPLRRGEGTLIRAQGVAISEHPLGPFIKSDLNPVIRVMRLACFHGRMAFYHSWLGWC